MENKYNELTSLVEEWRNLIDCDDVERDIWERKLLDFIYPIRFKEIDELDEIIFFMRNNDKSWKFLPGKPSSSKYFEKQHFNSFMDYFTRQLSNDTIQTIQNKITDSQLIIPCECDIESIGSVKDTSKIIRLKKNSENVVNTLKKLGFNNIDDYGFINMKLLLTYYHRIHSPINGIVKQIIPIEREDNFFGENSLWIVDIENNQFGNVYMLLVGESYIQDFDFKIKEGDYINKFDELGNFNWGSQTVMLYDTTKFNNNILVKEKTHYFVGDFIF